MIKPLIFIIFSLFISFTTSLAQGRWSMGFDIARRSEIRQNEDSYKYMYTRGGGGPMFSIGGSIAFQHNEKWRFESGLMSTPYSNTVAVYYNEPGYKRLLNRPLMYVGNTNSLEIPIKIIYNPSVKWKSINFNLLAGFNTYLLAGSINSRGSIGLSSIPVNPSPPTNLSVIYFTENLSTINFSLEAGAEAMWDLGKHFIFIYRFTGRLGFIDMVEMEGSYKTGQNISENPENIYPFRVVTNGTALHHTFSLRYRMGKKKEKQNWGDTEKTISVSKYKTNPMHGNGLNYVSFGLEIGPTLSRSSQVYPLHFALPVKVYLGRQKKGRFLVRTGFHYFPSTKESSWADVKRSYITIIPLAIGYRKNFNDWYVEGSVGAALNKGTTVFKDSSIENWSLTYQEINYGIEVGKQIGDFDIGLAVYNTGPIPFHILYAGIKGSYRIKW